MGRCATLMLVFVTRDTIFTKTSVFAFTTWPNVPNNFIMKSPMPFQSQSTTQSNWKKSTSEIENLVTLNVASSTHFELGDFVKVVDAKQSMKETKYNKETTKPPPISSANPEDDFTREIRKSWPLWVQNKLLRDSGLLRCIVDNILTPFVLVPSTFKQRPNLFFKFLQLSLFQTKKIAYGSHPLQTMDLVTNNKYNLREDPLITKNLVIVVHGGAYGFGRPWLYRLASLFLLNRSKSNETHVAVVGYRTYPDGFATDQVQDLDRAISTLLDASECIPYKHVAIVGHSSGSHIALLTIFRRLQRQIDSITTSNENIYDIGLDTFIGLSGISCVSSHYQFEKGRGLDQISPVAPACGLTDEKFLELSSGHIWEKMLSTMKQRQIDFNQIKIPSMLFLHGIEDDTVPYSATVELMKKLIPSSKTIHKIQAKLLEDVNHTDTINHFVYGGPSLDISLDWIENSKKE